jgi:hypothetical protein
MKIWKIVLGVLIVFVAIKSALTGHARSAGEATGMYIAYAVGALLGLRLIVSGAKNQRGPSANS